MRSRLASIRSRALLALLATVALFTVTGPIAGRVSAGIDGGQAAAQAINPAADLRVMMNDLLTAQAALTGLTLMKTIDGTPDLPAVRAALDTNSMKIRDAMAGIVGSGTADQMLAGLQTQANSFAAYASAAAADDGAGMSSADGNLNGVGQSVATLLASAMPSLSSGQVAGALQQNAATVEQFVNSYAAGDYPTAYAAAVTAVQQMGMMADMLAAATAAQSPDQFSGDLSSQRVEVRVQFDNLLAQHAAMAGLVLQKQALGAPDFQVANAQLDMNSVAISNFVGSLYGADPAAFLQLWRTHIELYMQYNDALASGDQAALVDADQALNGWVQDYTAFMTALDPNLDPGMLSEMTQTHVDQTKQVMQSFAAGDYPTTYATAAMAYDHMYMMGDMLIATSEAQFAGRQTGAVAPVAAYPSAQRPAGPAGATGGRQYRQRNGDVHRHRSTAAPR